MNREEKHLAQIFLKLKFYESDGQVYEDLFAKIMEKKNPNFRRVKPQGSIGDKKNDGFDDLTGTYYQVYAPENLHKSDDKAVSKLKEDFEGLVKYWEQITPVKSFFYVLNDKFKGTYPTIEANLSKLEKKFGIPCKPFLNKDLENTFWELNERQIIDIVGIFPNPETISNIDFSSLRKVVEFLLSKTANYSKEILPINLNFEQKIVFNNLSRFPGQLLSFGNIQSHTIQEYFQYRSDFTKEDLRKRFVELYVEGLTMFEDSENKSDLVFFHIFDSATPEKKKPIQDAVLVLMSYYFEFCDIFEPPL